jgi:hypothetical protein
MNELVPILLGAVVLAFVMAGVLIVVRNRRSVRELLLPIAGVWAVFLALSWMAVLLPGSSEGFIFLGAAAAAGIGMLLSARRRPSVRRTVPADRPEVWAIVVVGSIVGLILLLASNR